MSRPVSAASCSRTCRGGLAHLLYAAFSFSSWRAVMVVRGRLPLRSSSVNKAAGPWSEPRGAGRRPPPPTARRPGPAPAALRPPVTRGSRAREGDLDCWCEGQEHAACRRPYREGAAAAEGRELCPPAWELRQG
ncbi:hypothetical protein E2C01_100554 [Portunus trituberculatus]|uniref:Uncharacterized protein n=1 Tax=Portunus trituberculatus TaxID=210409 RepID=A0A5B7KDL0_PORTR|nr:hypothetical protein [Portunus trituberculatus]